MKAMAASQMFSCRCGQERGNSMEGEGKGGGGRERGWRRGEVKGSGGDRRKERMWREKGKERERGG